MRNRRDEGLDRLRVSREFRMQQFTMPASIVAKQTLDQLRVVDRKAREECDRAGVRL